MKKFFLIIFALIITVLFILTIDVLMNKGVNDINIGENKDDFERIVFVPGITTPKFFLNRWKNDLNFYFPDKEIIFLDDKFYLYWQYEKMERIISEGVGILNDGKKTLIISHSFGGILSKNIIKRSERANIFAFISMASPHTMTAFGIGASRLNLKTPDIVDAPTFSFGGYLDPIVLFYNSDLVNSIIHNNYWVEHLAFLYKKEIRKKVLEAVLNYENIKI